nr:VTT domain-containing protein [uncultured Catonella sp.]
MSEKNKKRITMAIISLVIIITLFFVKKFVEGKIYSVESLQSYMLTFGLFAPIVLVFLQAIQVVIPVLPGFLGCVVGAILFGPMGGFWCNYIGISLGSIVAYFLARKYGMDIILLMFPKKEYDKWSVKIKKSRSYGIFLFIATLLPLFPDDFLCYFSGLVKMEKKKFIWIILLGKPWCILVYSYVFGLV